MTKFSLPFSLLIACSVALAENAPPAPPLAGEWNMHPVHSVPEKRTVMALTVTPKEGQKYVGGEIRERLSGKHWDVEGLLYVDGSGSRTSYRLMMTRWFPITELDVVNNDPALRERALREYGSPARPGMLRGSIRLWYSEETKEWIGIYSVLGYRKNWAEDTFYEEDRDIRFSRFEALPDLALDNLTAKLQKVGDKEEWLIEARVRNNSNTDLAADKAHIQLQTAASYAQNDSLYDSEPRWYDNAKSIAKIPALKGGEWRVIQWISGEANFGNAQAVGKFSNTERYVQAVIDLPQSLPEANENNNRKALSRVHCDFGKILETAQRSLSAWLPLSTQRDKVARDPRLLGPDAYADLLKNVEAKKDKLEAVICYIRAEGMRRAHDARYTVAGSVTTEKMLDQFFADYLKNPNRDTGTAALEYMTRAQGLPSVGAGPRLWVPEGFRAHHNSDLIPKYIVPASHFFRFRVNGEWWKGDYYDDYPYWDVPFLVGGLNKTDNEDDDAIKGGRNQSNMMHWATGVKYSTIPADAWHELFLGYEYWHLEGFTVFGEDAINDLIAEEQGRLWGLKLRMGEDIRTREAFYKSMDQDFERSRAWVGQLLKAREKEFDEILHRYRAPVFSKWWKLELTYWAPWNQRLSVRDEIKKYGSAMQTIRQSKLVKHLVPIQELINWPEEYERRYNRAAPSLTEVTRKTLAGDYNQQFTDAPHEFDAEWDWRP